MDTNNWRPNPSVGEPNMDTGDWRAQLPPDSRQRNGGDWQEEVYQKIKTMKEMYLPELNEMYGKIAAKLHQHDSLPQQPKSDQLEKLKIFKTMLERIITFLQVSKNNISPGFKEKLGSYEKQIVYVINKNICNQMNQQMQSMNIPGSMAAMQQNNVTNVQHNSVPSVSGVSTAQQNMLNSLQPGSHMDSGQGSSLSSMHQVNVGSLLQNSNLMDTNNWRPNPSVGEPNMDTGDWRAHLPPDSRQRIVNKIMDTLKSRLPVSGQEGLDELKKIAGRFEEKIYTAATSQSDYLRKISLKMLSMESKSQNAMPNSLPSNNVGGSN